MLLLQTFKEPKNVRKTKEQQQVEVFEIFLARWRLLSSFPANPTVGNLRGKKENCSTRKGLRVGTGFREFPQTPRGRGFSLLEFYSHFKCFMNV